MIPLNQLKANQGVYWIQQDKIMMDRIVRVQTLGEYVLIQLPHNLNKAPEDLYSTKSVAEAQLLKKLNKDLEYNISRIRYLNRRINEIKLERTKERKKARVK